MRFNDLFFCLFWWVDMGGKFHYYYCKFIDVDSEEIFSDLLGGTEFQKRNRWDAV